MMTRGSTPYPSQRTSSGATAITGMVCETTTSGVRTRSSRRECTAAAAKRNAVTAPSARPAPASSTVTSALRAYSPGWLNSSASTADGGGKMKAATWVTRTTASVTPVNAPKRTRPGANRRHAGDLVETRRAVAAVRAGAPTALAWAPPARVTVIRRLSDSTDKKPEPTFGRPGIPVFESAPRVAPPCVPRKARSTRLGDRSSGFRIVLLAASSRQPGWQ